MRLNLFLLVVILSAISFERPVSAESAIWRSYFDAGRISLLDGDTKKAGQLFDLALKEARSDERSKSEQAASLFAIGYMKASSKPSDAMTSANESLTINDGIYGANSTPSAFSHELLGDLNSSAKKYDDAESEYRKALKGFELIPNSAARTGRLLTKLSTLYENEGKKLESEALKSQVPNNATTFPSPLEDYSAFLLIEAKRHPGITFPQTSLNSNGPDFGPYMADLQLRIKRQWFPPKGCESKRVVAIFRVHRDGHISDLKLVTGSGVPEADDAALNAIQKASPFRALPTGASEAAGIQFTFDYNVFAGGGKGTFRTF